MCLLLPSILCISTAAQPVVMGTNTDLTLLWHARLGTDCAVTSKSYFSPPCVGLDWSHGSRRPEGRKGRWRPFGELRVQSPSNLPSVSALHALLGSLPSLALHRSYSLCMKVVHCSTVTEYVVLCFCHYLTLCDASIQSCFLQFRNKGTCVPDRFW